MMLNMMLTLMIEDGFSCNMIYALPVAYVIKIFISIRQFQVRTLRLLDTYASKIAKICILWTFWLVKDCLLAESQARTQFFCYF